MPINHLLSDISVLVGRSMRHAFRSMDTLITVVAMPVMMMLLFVFVFSGSISTGSIKYINYVVPGILLMGITSGAAYSAVNLNNDITKGIVDRFRSMPIAKFAILMGHVLTWVVFSIFSAVLIVVFAFLVGFRTDAGITKLLLASGILLLYTFAMTWISVIFGLLANSAEGAGAFSYLLLLLNFVSSAFVPTKSMNAVVRTFAENQPMTPIIEAVRSLLLNGPIGSNTLSAVLWSSGILIVAVIVAMQLYKSKMA